MPTAARARNLSTKGLFRVRQHGRVEREKFIEQIDWLLDNFDFRRGRILVNADEDIEVFAKDLRHSRGVMGRVGAAFTGSVLRTYYFADEELGMLFRLKYV